MQRILLVIFVVLAVSLPTKMHAAPKVGEKFPVSFGTSGKISVMVVTGPAMIGGTDAGPNRYDYTASVVSQAQSIANKYGDIVDVWFLRYDTSLKLEWQFKDEKIPSWLKITTGALTEEQRKTLGIDFMSVPAIFIVDKNQTLRKAQIGWNGASGNWLLNLASEVIDTLK